MIAQRGIGNYPRQGNYFLVAVKRLSETQWIDGKKLAGSQALKVMMDLSLNNLLVILNDMEKAKTPSVKSASLRQNRLQVTCL